MNAETISVTRLRKLRGRIRTTVNLVGSGEKIGERPGSWWRANLETREVEWTPSWPFPPHSLIDDLGHRYLVAHEASHLKWSGKYTLEHVPDHLRMRFHRFYNWIEDIRVDRLSSRQFGGFEEAMLHVRAILRTGELANHPEGWSLTDAVGFNAIRAFDIGEEPAGSALAIDAATRLWPRLDRLGNARSSQELVDGLEPIFLELIRIEQEEAERKRREEEERRRREEEERRRQLEEELERQRQEREEQQAAQEAESEPEDDENPGNAASNDVEKVKEQEEHDDDVDEEKEEEEEDEASADGEQDADEEPGEEDVDEDDDAAGDDEDEPETHGSASGSEEDGGEGDEQDDDGADEGDDDDPGAGVGANGALKDEADEPADDDGEDSEEAHDDEDTDEPGEEPEPDPLAGIDALPDDVGSDEPTDAPIKSDGEDGSEPLAFGEELEGMAEDATSWEARRSLEQDGVANQREKAQTRAFVDKLLGRRQTPTSAGVERYQARLSEWRGRINVLTLRLKTVLRHNSMANPLSGQRRGRFDPGKAYRLRTGNVKVFQRPGVIGGTDYTFGLLIDASHSMWGGIPGADPPKREVEAAFDATVLVAEALENAGLGVFLILWDEHMRHVKPLQEPLRAHRGSIGTILGAGSGGDSTKESQAVGRAIDEFELVPHGKRMLITITDGRSDTKEESKELLDELEQMGVRCCTVRIGGEPGDHYKRGYSVKHADELTTLLPQIVNEIVTRGG